MPSTIDVVRSIVADHFGESFSPESVRGPADQVDLFAKSKRFGEIRVEVELRREDPLNNVAKAWRQSEDQRRPFLFVHVFSGYYRRKAAKRLNAEFVGRQMDNWAVANGLRVTYLPLSFDYEPPKNADAGTPLPTDVADEIRNQLLSELASAEPLLLGAVRESDSPLPIVSTLADRDIVDAFHSGKQQALQRQGRG